MRACVRACARVCVCVCVCVCVHLLRLTVTYKRRVTKDCPKPQGLVGGRVVGAFASCGGGSIGGRVVVEVFSSCVKGTNAE